MFNKNKNKEVPQQANQFGAPPGTQNQSDVAKMQELENAIIKLSEKIDAYQRNTNEYVKGIASTVTQVAEKVEKVEGQNVAGVTRLTDEQRISNIEQAIIKLGGITDAIANQFTALIDDYLAFKGIVKIKKEKPSDKVSKKKRSTQSKASVPIPEPEEESDEYEDDDEYEDEEDLV